MSITKSIGCISCRVKLTIGQTPGDVFYSGEPETMKKLRDFLYNHQFENHHILRFGIDDYYGDDDPMDMDCYKDLDPEFEGKEQNDNK